MKDNMNLAYYQTYHKPLEEYEPREIWNEIDKRRDGHDRTISWEEERHAEGLKMYCQEELVGYLSALQRSLHSPQEKEEVG